MLRVAVGLMAKYPELGKVKTRLAADIGEAEALRLYTHLLQLATETLRQLDTEQFQTSVFVAQETLVYKFRDQYPGARHYEAQTDGDLGERMRSAFDRLLASESASCAILIGADIPDLSAELIVEAGKALEQKDVVLGPTFDGGYYLIGLRTVIPELFSGIEWGGESVLIESQRRSRRLGYKVKTLETLTDLDTLQDVHRLSSRNRLIIQTLRSYLDQDLPMNKEL